MQTPTTKLVLADFTLPAKVLLTLFLAIIGLGYFAALLNIYEHHHNADQNPALGLGDLRRVYHGLDKEVTVTTAVDSEMLHEVRPDGGMRKSLEKGGEPAVRTLIAWLEMGAPQDRFMQAGLVQPGDPSPQQVIRNQCIRCHAAGGRKADLPYAASADAEPEYALVSKVALPPAGKTTTQRKMVHLPPMSFAELVQVTHVHILSIPVFTLIVGGLFLMTGLPYIVKLVLAPLPMLAILMEIASWWLARPLEPFVLVIAAAGAVFGISYGLQIICIAISLWFGRRQRANATAG